mmetsp:Transcript_33300/g.82800  ORF Transcript_33300/g.82800 Transcript_33300/m.82800 type:complete len:224 (+) Transcript_33300:405-1076(+)
MVATMCVGAGTGTGKGKGKGGGSGSSGKAPRRLRELRGGHHDGPSFRARQGLCAHSAAPAAEGRASKHQTRALPRRGGAGVHAALLLCRLAARRLAGEPVRARRGRLAADEGPAKSAHCRAAPCAPLSDGTLRVVRCNAQPARGRESRPAAARPGRRRRGPPERTAAGHGARRGRPRVPIRGPPGRRQADRARGGGWCARGPLLAALRRTRRAARPASGRGRG